MTVLERLKAAGYDPAKAITHYLTAGTGEMECARIAINTFRGLPLERNILVVTATAFTALPDGPMGCTLNTGRTIWKPLHVCTFRLMLSSGAVRLTRKTAASTTAMFFLTASCQIADTSLELATGAMPASGPEMSRAGHRQCGACGRASLRTTSPHGLRWRKSTSMLRKCSGVRFTDRRKRPCSTLPMMRSCGMRMRF